MELGDIGGFVERLRRGENRVGGKYLLSALVQKRAVELMRGAPPLVDVDSNDLAEIALNEVLAEKIDLAYAEAREGEGL
jgi:DNA-directed RNA polymerase subunit K/omega